MKEIEKNNINQFEIDKNIPINKIRWRSSKNNYPFDKIEIGDSFLIPIEKTKSISAVRGSVNNYLISYNRIYKKSIKICTRQCDDGLRVWRTE
jgi:hypothetical protein